MIVIDACALLELLLQTARGVRVTSLALAPEARLHGPHQLDVEVAQALRRLIQLREVTAARAQQALDDHAALVIDRHGHEDLLPRIWQLRESISAYDATYVALAGSPGVTAAHMRQQARALSRPSSEGGISGVGADYLREPRAVGPRAMRLCDVPSGRSWSGPEPRISEPAERVG